MGQALLGIGAGAAGAFGGAYDAARKNRQQSQMGNIEIQNAQRDAASLAAAGQGLSALAGMGGGGAPGMQGPPGMPQGGPQQPPMPQPGGAAMGRGSSTFPSPGQQVFPGQNPMGMPGQPPPRPMQASFPGAPPPMPPNMAAQAPGGPPMPQMSAQAGMPQMAAMAPGGQPRPTMPFPGQQAPSAGLTPAQAPGGGPPSSSPPPGGLRGREQLDPSMQGRGQMPQPSSLDWRTIVQAVQKTGAPPDVQMAAVNRLVNFMTPVARMEWLQAHNQFLENQLRERQYEANIRYGRPQPTKQVGLQQEQPPGGQPPRTQQASMQGGPDLSGGERVIKAGLTESGGEAPPDWAKEQPPEVSNSPVVTGKLPDEHAFSSAEKGYKLTENDMDHALGIYHYMEPPLLEGRVKENIRQISIMNVVRKLGREYGEPYDVASYAAHQRGTVNFTTGPQANTIRSIGVAQRHLDTLGELARNLEKAKGGESNAQFLAKLNNVIRTQFQGAPEANNIDAAKQIIAAEVVKAVNASGGGVKERLEASTHIDPSLNVRQMQGVIDTYSKLLSGQIKGFEGQWRRVPGNKDRDFYSAFPDIPNPKKGAGEKSDDKSGAGAAPKGGVTPGGIKWEMEPMPIASRAFGSSSERTNEPEWQPAKGRKILADQLPSKNIEDRRRQPQYYRSVKELSRLMEETDDPEVLDQLEEELQGAMKKAETKRKKK